MPKKRRIYLGMPRNKKVPQTPTTTSDSDTQKDEEILSARGKLKGALKDMMEPSEEDNDASEPESRDRTLSDENNKNSDKKKSNPLEEGTPFVLKLFDRTVDLSQFNDNTPLYPVCRAWIINKAKANYKDLRVLNVTVNETEETITLPGPVGPEVSRVPDLIPEQKASTKDNIQLEYGTSPLPTKKELLKSHQTRWAAVRQAWLRRAVEVESRYQETQDILEQISAGT